MDPQQITKLAHLLRENGDKLLNNGFSFQLSGSMLRALNDSFTLIMESATPMSPNFDGNAQNFMVLKPNNCKSPVYRELQLIFDFVQKTTLLCIAHKAGEEYNGLIDVSKFRALKRLELHKVPVRQIIGIQPLRAQLQELICVKSLQHVEEIITRCGGDNSNGFVWNELKVADFSYNNLQKIDTSLEFAQYLQHLNLRHNQLVSVEAIKWLPHLKSLDLSFNNLRHIPLLHVEACKRLQSLNISNNLLEDLMCVGKLDAITDLDVSDNFLMKHVDLLPLSVLLTLKYLNLSGNSLCCHVEHRLTTAKYLHKNCATVKFILDSEPLTKHEKSVTGTYQWRPNRFNQKSSTISISSTQSKLQTPASSVGSTFSNAFYTEAETATVTPDSSQGKRQRGGGSTKSRSRIVEINNVDDDDHFGDHHDEDVVEGAQRASNLSTSTLGDNNSQLHATSSEIVVPQAEATIPEPPNESKMMTSILESSPMSQDGRILLDQYLGEFAQSTQSASSPSPTISTIKSNDKYDALMPFNERTRTSTPTTTNKEVLEEIISPIKVKTNAAEKPTTAITSPSASTVATDQTLDQTYYSANDESATTVADDLDEKYRDIFSTSVDDAPQISDVEDDEETYIVYAQNSNDPIFLTLSSNYLREKDTSEITKTKWSLQMLESSELLTADTLRLNFDTLMADRRTRTYKVEDGLCHELQNKLRDILSHRDLSEMNHIVYRCVKCDSEFVAMPSPSSPDVSCPNCRSTFVTEITEKQQQMPQQNLGCSPATSVKEMVAKSALSLTTAAVITAAETASIGSANSLNESSSCSKITNSSQNSFDSNQSVVGSTNTDRINFAANCESDVDILSNPSQSSIEVLEGSQYSQQQQQQRKTSSDDQSNVGNNLESCNANGCTPTSAAAEMVSADNSTLTETAATLPTPTASSELKAHFLHLTESSSSGSVTDSICTAYEQTEKCKSNQSVNAAHTKQFLVAEAAAESSGSGNNASNSKAPTTAEGDAEKETSKAVLSTVIGAIFQSTNALMAPGAKKNAENAGANTASSNNKSVKSSGNNNKSAANSQSEASVLCTPYKFNFSDYSDIDHRLKLYFLQHKFQQQDIAEQFKWVARGRIYNECTNVFFDGLVVVSTCQMYLLEAYAPEHDDVTQWLRMVDSVPVQRLECVQILPWKVGLAFTLRSWGGFLLFLQDILRTDNLLQFFYNYQLPPECKLNYQISPTITNRLSAVLHGELLTMLALLDACEVSLVNSKRSFKTCALLTTDCHIYLTSEQLAWLSVYESNTTQPANVERDVQVCVTQTIDNLVEVVRKEAHIFALKFFDETHNIEQVWQCTFATKDNAACCLNSIALSWESLFGVPLCMADV